MANIPNQLQVHILHTASSISYILPAILVLVLVILLAVLSVLVVVRLTRKVSELVHANAALQLRLDTCEISLSDPVVASECGDVVGSGTSLVSRDRASQSTTPAPAPAVVAESESERVQALEARLDFLRNSCNVLIAQKNDLVARQNEDLATLKAQLAIAHQTKDELLAEKDACCKTLLEQKNGELASLRVQLATTHQAVAAITTTRDEAVARAGIIAKELETTRADYTSLTSLVADAEGNVATLNAMVQQQKTEIGDILLKHISLSAELTKVRDLYHSDLERRRVQEVRSLE